MATLTSTEADVLRYLDREGPSSCNEIASQLARGFMAVRSTATALRKQRLVSFRRADGIYLYHLTDTGAELARQLG